MGGTKARIAAAAVAACGTLSLAAPAHAGTAGALDDTARDVAPVSQEVDAIGPPAVEQVVSIVRDTAKVPPPIERETPAKGNDRGAVPATPVQPGPRSTHRADWSGAATPIARDTRPARARVRAETDRPSPPHGRKAMPPARSHEERAAGAGPAHGSLPEATQPTAPPRPGSGLAALAQALDTVSGTVFTAFLILVLATSLPLRFNRLRIPAPIVRRPAFIPLLGPPG
jgi:hypothetical protein